MHSVCHLCHRVRQMPPPLLVRQNRRLSLLLRFRLRCRPINLSPHPAPSVGTLLCSPFWTDNIVVSVGYYSRWCVSFGLLVSLPGMPASKRRPPYCCRCSWLFGRLMWDEVNPSFAQSKRMWSHTHGSQLLQLHFELSVDNLPSVLFWWVW